MFNIKKPLGPILCLFFTICFFPGNNIFLAGKNVVKTVKMPRNPHIHSSINKKIKNNIGRNNMKIHKSAMRIPQTIVEKAAVFIEETPINVLQNNNKISTIPNGNSGSNTASSMINSNLLAGMAMGSNKGKILLEQNLNNVAMEEKEILEKNLSSKTNLIPTNEKNKSKTANPVKIQAKGNNSKDKEKINRNINRENEKEKMINTEEKSHNSYDDIIFEYKERMGNKSQDQGQNIHTSENSKSNNSKIEKKMPDVRNTPIMGVMGSSGLNNNATNNSPNNTNSGNPKDPIQDTPNDTLTKETDNNSSKHENKEEKSISLNTAKVANSILHIWDHFEITMGNVEASGVIIYKYGKNPWNAKAKCSTKIGMALENFRLISQFAVQKKHGASFSLSWKLDGLIEHNHMSYGLLIFTPLVGNKFASGSQVEDKFVNKALHKMNAAGAKKHYLFSIAPGVDPITKVSDIVLNFALDFSQDKKKHGMSFQVKYLLGQKIPISCQLVKNSIEGKSRKVKEFKVLSEPLSPTDLQKVHNYMTSLRSPQLIDIKDISYSEVKINKARKADIYKIVLQGRTPELLERKVCVLDGEDRQISRVESLLIDSSFSCSIYKENNLNDYYASFAFSLSMPVKISFGKNIAIEFKTGIKISRSYLNDVEDNNFMFYNIYHSFYKSGASISSEAYYQVIGVIIPLSLEIKLPKIKICFGLEINANPEKLIMDKNNGVDLSSNVFTFKHGTEKKGYLAKFEFKITGVDLTSEKKFIIQNSKNQSSQSQYDILVNE